MKYTINNKEYELHFGLKFLRELDKIYTHEFGAIKFGLGVQKVFLMLSQFNAVALSDVLYAGLSTDPDMPTRTEIDNHIESLSAEGVVEKCNFFMDTLAENSITKPQISQIALVAHVMTTTTKEN